jgi:hypothetical protein
MRRVPNDFTDYALILLFVALLMIAASAKLIADPSFLFR